jgi:signal transduction histidine kinase/ligand-binding sensor domain-containing protein
MTAIGSGYYRVPVGSILDIISKTEAFVILIGRNTKPCLQESKNVCLDRAHRRSRAPIALGILLALCPSVFALEASRDVSQYAHTAWRVSEGFAKGAIFSIAQTPDGYLWLGTEFGLLRFDGVRLFAWQPPAGARLPSSDIRSLLVARDGRLWIGTTEGLASWKDGQLTHYRALDGRTIETLLEDREGMIWVGAWSPSVGTLCTIQSGSTQCYGEDGRFGSGVTALYEDSRGNLWAGGETGLWRWKPGPPQFYPIPDATHRINDLIEDDGGLLIAQNSGITRLKNGKAEAYPLPAGLNFKPRNLLRDRNGGLWIGASTDAGLLHLHEGRTDLFRRSDGMSGDAVSSLLEDREGNIWVTTTEGLDRFREFAVYTISVKQGLSSGGVSAVLAARDGSIWLGTDNGLNRWNSGNITVYGARKPSSHLTAQSRGDSASTVRTVPGNGLPDVAVDSLFEDERGQIWVATHRGVAVLQSDRFVPISSLPTGIVYAITAGSAGDVWISHQNSLFHLHRGDVVEEIPWTRLGLQGLALSLVADPSSGGLWLGLTKGGVAYVKDGQVRATYTAEDGLGEGRISQLRFGSRGSLWAATEGGLSRIRDGNVATLTSKNGLPCDVAHWSIEDDDHSVWLYMPCGLVQISRSELDAWVADPNRTIKATVFDRSDGVKSHSFTPGYSPSVAKSADGKLWFLPFGGVSVIDPRHLPFNKLPPLVHIEQITADGQTYDASQGLRLPPLVRDLTIDYTALSLVALEKVHFRFKLDAQDDDWREVVNDRRVQYSNLAPGRYRFRVLASNNSGVWNEEGVFLEFSIAPAYYQTTWFRAACVAAFLMLLWALYQLRLRQVARQFNRGLEERVGERTRIARELHDTLLQSFQGVLLKFSAVRFLLPPESDEAQKTLEKAIDQAEQAIADGRDAVQGLRSSTVPANDLARVISALGEELAGNQTGQDPPVLRVDVEGVPQSLAPLLQDEVHRIAVETLRNAYRHAGARRIEVEIRYGKRQFRLRVRDNGKGIDQNVVDAGGRERHFGLTGMRERAELVGGNLAIWSELDSGTEIELTIPASVAYAKPPTARRSIFLRKRA